MPRRKRIPQTEAGGGRKYEGLQSARQPNETTEEFLARLPPASTDISPEVPWIYIDNPFHSTAGRKPKDVARFLEGGEERLNLLLEAVPKIKSSGKTQAAIARELTRYRAEASQSLLNLAQDCNIFSGKWLLFPGVGQISSAWEVVASATATDELGTSAKVAPRDPDHPEDEQVICVYTRDFRDIGDICRVLNRLRELCLVEPRGKCIYYKCGEYCCTHSRGLYESTNGETQPADAWSYLRIVRDNVWKLRPWMVSNLPAANLP